MDIEPERPTKRTRIENQDSSLQFTSNSNEGNSITQFNLPTPPNFLENVDAKENSAKILEQSLELNEIIPKENTQIISDHINEQEGKTERKREINIAELLSAALSIRETHLRELLFLSQENTNILDIHENSSKLNQLLEEYHQNNSLFSSSINLKNNNNNNNSNNNKKEAPIQLISSNKSDAALPKIKISLKGTNTQNPFFSNGPSNGIYNTTNTSGISTISGQQLSSLLSTKVNSTGEDITSKASKDSDILKRINELEKEGLWGAKRLNKAAEPPRVKVHWDFLLSEMAWLAMDFKEERRWKMALAKKLAKQAQKYHEANHSKIEKQLKDDEIKIKKVAKNISSEVKKFWSKIEKVAQLKNQIEKDAIKRKQLDKQLDLLVVQTERFTQLVKSDLSSSTTPTTTPTTTSNVNITVPPSSSSLESVNNNPPLQVTSSSSPVANEDPSIDKVTERENRIKSLKSLYNETEEKNLSSTIDDIDNEFIPSGPSSEDDEATIEQAEKELVSMETDLQKEEDELLALQRESEIPIEVLVEQYENMVSNKHLKKSKKQKKEKEVKEEIVETSEEEEENEEEEEEDKEILEQKELIKQQADKSEKERITEAATTAKLVQPTGTTLSTTSVKTKVPYLLRGTLREYQHIGLDWLVTMYDKNLNGILADEMGLGKTIMTISLLAHLACEKGIWGPHLIIVPTSMMINWELEFKRWCPGFKIMTYFGSLKERKLKRVGWSKPNAFHICITSYKLVIQDQAAFRRKKWKYMILDEAHNIKNFRSQRWQSLLNFKSLHRLLLTGTPLQNSLMELWSLMHFLMPHVFQSHKEFKDWFANPVNNMIEGDQEVNEDIINRLHAVLRPFLLRRLKSEVEQQLPPKHHHIVPCKLSKRQRFLYEEFIESASTQKTLSSGNFLGIVNVLMQLRKVCNHPDLFEVRPIISPFDQMQSIVYHSASIISNIIDHSFSFLSFPISLASLDLSLLGLPFLSFEHLSTYESDRISQLIAPLQLLMNVQSSIHSTSSLHSPQSFLTSYKQYLEDKKNQEQLECIKHIAYLNTRRSNQRPLYGRNIIHLVKIEKPSDIHITAKNPRKYLEYSSILQNMIKTYEQRTFDLQEKEGIGLIEKFTCIIPKARAPPITCHFSHPSPSIVSNSNQFTETLISSLLPSIDIFRSSFVRLQLFFPDKRLIQFDSGKLQELADLLRSLKKGDHRALLFTQMTRMLDILEIFLNIHGYRYLRLDGSTKPEKRQMMMERFNKDKRIFLFILSTRSGGIGVNLTGADTVIFYDSDWNPAMDAQAQDRCHRIGQTREVHIYRMVTELSIEENILKKANQKRILEDVAIDSGGFTTDFFKSVDLRDLITSDSFKSNRSNKSEVNVTEQDWTKAISAVEEESDVIAMKDAQRDYSLSIVSDDFDDSSVSNIKIDANANDMDLHSISTEIETTITTTIDTNNNNNNNNNNNIEEDPFASELTPVQRYALRTIQSGRSVLESQRVIGKSLLFLFIDKDKGEVVSMETEEKGLNEQNEEKEKEEKTEKEGETSEKDSNYNKEDKDNDSDDDSVILPSSSSTSNNTTSSSSSSSSHGSNITSTNVSQSKQNENGSNSSNTSEKTRSNNEGKTTDSELKQKLKRKGRRKSTELFYEVKDINGKKDILKEELETIIYGDMSLIAPPNPDMGMTTNLLLSRGTVTKTASGLGASAVDLYGFGNSTPHLGDLYHYYDGEDYTSFGIGYGYIIDTDLYIPPLDDLEYIGLFPSKESTLDLPLEDTLDSLTLLNTIQKKKEQVKENNIKESAQQKGIQQIDVMQAIANVLANDQFIENSLISSMHVDHSHVILPTVQDVTPVKSEKIHKRKKIHVESEISFEISSAEGTESIKSTKTSEKSHKKIKQISPEPSSVSNKELEDSLDVPVIEDLEDSLDFPSTKKKKGEKKQKKEKEKTKKEKKKNTQKIQQPVDSNSLFDDSEFPMPSEDNNTSKKNRKNSRITVTTTNVNSSSSTVNSTAAPKTKRNRNAATTVITTSTNNTTTTTTSNNTNNNSTFITAPYTVTSDKDIKYSASLSNSNFGMKITNATDEIAPLPTPSSVFVHPWTLEEDKIINYAKSKYGMNWEIIADIVNSIPRVFVKRVRSKKHCSDHFKSISTNSSLDSDSSSSNVDSKDLLASYFQTTITNPTFSVSDLFKKIPPSASSNSPSSTSSTSSTGSPSLSSSNTVPIPSKQKGRSRSVSTNLSSNVLQNSNNITSAQGPSNPLNSTNISDSNFLTHTSHHTVASLAANIPFVTPQISGFKSRNPSDIALFKLQKERERREKEVHPITSNTISSVSSSSSMNSGNNSQSNNNLNTTLVHGNQQGFSSNPLLPHTNPVRSASSSNPSSVTQSLDAKFRMQSGSFPSHLQRNISPAFQGNIQDPNISPPNSRAVIPNQGLIRSASSPGIQSSNPNILSSNNMLASNSSSQHSLPSQSSIHGNFPPNTVVTGHPKTSSSNSTQPGMQMTVGLGIPMQSSMGNKISPGIPSNAAVHLNPGVRTSNSQKINILPNSAPNNTNNISVHPSFAHPMTANRQTNMGNQSSFSQPHFVTQANIVGSSQSIPIPINSSVTISPSVNPSHQFMQNVQAPQVFMPVHPTQKKT